MLSDRIVVRITSKPGETFVDRMIALVEGAARQKTPNEIALNILLASLSIVFVVVVLTLNPIASYAAAPASIPVLIALLVCLIPTTIGALLSAIGIAGMDRLVQRNVLAMSGRAVEAAGDVTTLLLDKTGTITYGNRRASEFVPMPGVDVAELERAAALASLADPTPEGSSIVDARGRSRHPLRDAPAGEVVPFTAQTRMSGSTSPTGRIVRKGAGSAVIAWVEESGRIPSSEHDELDERVDAISASGGTPLVVAEKAADGTARILGVVHLKDIVKDGLVERFAELRAMGIRTVMITGDNPLTAKAIAAEAGVDDYLAEATPEDKMALIRQRAGGRQPRRDDRRRHERRPGARAGGRRRGDEHGHVGREGGRQHGRPRLRPDEAHRHRGASASSCSSRAARSRRSRSRTTSRSTSRSSPRCSPGSSRGSRC